MKKRFLLIAGDECYPAVTRDWVGFFETREEAERHVSEMPVQRLREAKITINGHYRNVDWYEIVDIENWKFTLYDEGELRWGWYPIDETSDWYDCAHCEAGYPDQECTCEGFIKGEE